MGNRLFEQTSIKKPKKNVFDLSHERKLSMNMGDLVPIYIEEVVPGDKFKVSTEQLIRLAPLVSPMMHRVNCYTHFFFVPNRLVFSEWKDFITGGKDGTAAPAFPVIATNQGSVETKLTRGSLADYMGIPPIVGTGQTNPLTINALPFRAYQLIYNEYFRDQTLNVEIPFGLGSTVSDADAVEIMNIRKRSWEKDYFTSALPWAQRGADVAIPGTGATGATINYYPYSRLKYNDGGDLPANSALSSSANVMTFPNGANGRTIAANAGSVRVENIQDITLTGGTQATINDLRKATRVQQWLEKNARGGYRYIEQILQHFGVVSSDARLQRPEFLGGGINPIVVSEVLSTAKTTDLPQGNMAGHGISVGHDNQFTKYFEEHGYIIGIMSVIPRSAYYQGIPRKFFRTSKFDFFWPEFANIGEQPIYNKEIYADYKTGYPNNTFGYTPRYSEYKFHHDSVHGDFRNTLEFWHMGRKFANEPTLNDVFPVCDPTLRVFAVTDPNVHHLYCQVYNKVTAIRPMPKFGTPI